MSAFPAPSHLSNLSPSHPPHQNPLQSFWTKNYSSPLTNANSATQLPSSADIVIIGSGITGSTAAAKLVESLISRKVGAKIVVLEAREFCSGATGRNGGHLTALPRLEFATLVEACGGVEDAKRSVLLEDRAVSNVTDVCEKNGWEAEVELRTNGCVHFFETEEADAMQRTELEAASVAGVDLSSITWISASEALSKYGAKAHSGVLLPGRTIYPLKFVTKLFSHAQSLAKDSSIDISLEVYTHALAEGISPSKRKDGRWRIKTSRGEISANQILHATNAYATYLLPHLTQTKNQIIPTRGQVISITPPTPPNHPNTNPSFASLSEYLFHRPSGDIIIGGARAFAGPPFEAGVTDDSSVNEIVGKKLRENVKALFGWSEDGEVAMEWTGIMGYKETGHPLMGKVYQNGQALEGQWICAGYTGHGMARAPACAETVAGMILADKFNETFAIPEWLPRVYVPNVESWDSLVEPKKRGWAFGCTAV